MKKTTDKSQKTKKTQISKARVAMVATCDLVDALFQAV